MPVLTYAITSTTRTNALTATSVTVKKVVPSIDGVELLHHYVFDGATTDVSARASVKADLQGPKGYGVLTEV